MPLAKIPIIYFTFFLFITSSCNLSGNNKANYGIEQNDTLNKIDTYLTQLEKNKNFSGGLLISKNGKKIFSKGYGWAEKEHKIKFASNTLASMGSITKAFTAAAIMKLVGQNKIALTDSLKHFFPDVPKDKQGITIHQLLTHSSGFVEFLKEDGGDYEVINTQQFLKRAFTQPLAFKPGEKAVYTNVGMSILGIIIEKISGTDYETYLRKNLFEPVAIRKIGYHYPAASNDTIAVGYQNGNRWGTHSEHFAAAGGGPYWNLKANGGLEVSLDEMYLWTNAISEHKILSEASVNKMFTPHVLEEGYNGKSSFGYGCNISKSRRNTKVIDNGGSNGIYFARLIRLPEEGLVFYMVTNESSMNTNLVLPNVSQLYFQGKITQDASVGEGKFQTPMAKRIYAILNKPGTKDLKEEFVKENITVDDDMILLNVGESLIEEKQLDKAIILYKYYTATFPKIVVSWNDLGEIYLNKGMKAEAKNCFEQALKLRPGNPRAKKGLENVAK